MSERVVRRDDSSDVSLVGSLVGPPEEPEPGTPHRFTRLLGATVSLLAGGLLAMGSKIAGYVLAASIGLLAAIAAETGFCLGCRMYRHVSVLGRRGVL